MKRFLFLFCVMLAVNTGVYAQSPDPVAASGITGACSNLMGTYNYDSDVMGKPAYVFNTSAMGNPVTYILVWSGSQWEMGSDSDNDLSINGSVLFSNPDNTSLPPAEGWVKEPNCSGATGTLVFSGGVDTGAGNDVPTLSQWGLIILALFFMTLGTLYLLQPQFNQLQKQEV